MSTEAINLDQAVDKLMAFDEPVQESETDSVEEADAVEKTQISDEDEVTEEVSSEVDDSDEEYDTEDDSTEDDSEPDQSEPEKFTVKVDGEEVTVTLEDLKRSYSGQGKIQRGMQEAAKVRKEVETQREQLNAAMQQLSAMYEQAQNVGFRQPPTEPNPEIFNTDPMAYMEAKIKYDQDLKSYQEEVGRMRQMQEYQLRQSEQQRQQQLQVEMEKLRSSLPELTNPKTANEFKNDLVKYGSEYGYNTDELSSITDSRAIQVLADAMKWRKSQNSRKSVEAKVEGARKVIPPKAKVKSDPKAKQRRDKQSKLRKTGSVEDALSLILNS